MAGTILIYGGTGGIGASTARHVRTRGFDVHLAARDVSKLKALSEEIGATYTAGDVTEEAFFAAASREAAEHGGGALQGLIYAVGSINLKPVGRLTEADFLGDFRLNALGAVQAVQAALPALKKAEGKSSILLFSTVAVHQGFAAHASVAMAKGAVEGLMRSLAAELAPHIRVNCIAPSLTRTALAQGLTANDAMATAIAQMHAMQRLGNVADIGPMAAMLMSEDASWITGQVIGIDGGRSTLRTKG